MGNSDSHASFVDGVQRLLVEDVPEDDDEFWNALFSAPMSVEDVFEVISPDNIRLLKQRRPQNLQVFLRRIIATSAAVCKGVDDDSSVDTVSASTAVRLLTRIVPFLLEEPDDDVVHDILWKPGGYQVAAATATPVEGDAPPSDATAEDQLVEEKSRPSPLLATEPSHPEVAAAASENGAASSKEAEMNGGEVDVGAKGEVIAHEILHHLGRFLFLPSLSVTPRAKVTGPDRPPLPTDRPTSSMIWKGGVHISSELPVMNTTPNHFRVRSEVLRCLLACLSGPLFRTVDEYQDNASPWLLWFTGGKVVNTANLFCSLMATAFSYDPVGWGMPYGGHFARGCEEDLVDVSLQVLCVLMDFDPRPPVDVEGVVVEKGAEEAAVGAAPPTPMSATSGEERIKKKLPRNVYRIMLEKIEKDVEIDLIFNGIVRLLSTVHQANQTFLPNSFRSVGFYQEALVLLWHLVTLNQNFLRRVVEHLDTNKVLLPVLYLLQQSQNSPQHVGLLHTASFVLLVLSSERAFAVRLNEPYAGKVPLRIPQFQGCHADVLALGLHQVISDSLPRQQNDALVEMLLTVLCNVSPYIKCFALESCLKLLSLIDRCARPQYLFRSAFTHHGLIFLLEMLNNIIQYQYEGNTMLVYSILRQKEVIHRLAALAVPEKAVAKAPENGEADAQAPEEQLPDAQAPEAQAPEAQALEAQSPEAPAPDVQAFEAEDAAWAPTEPWLMAWKKKMPLQPLQCLIDYLSPKVEAMCKDSETGQDDVLTYLKTTTMVGVLPVPHPIVIRTYQASGYTAMWFTSYMWGVIFTRSQRLPLYDWKKIRLVVINQ